VLSNVIQKHPNLCLILSFTADAGQIARCLLISKMLQLVNKHLLHSRHSVYGMTAGRFQRLIETCIDGIYLLIQYESHRNRKKIIRALGGQVNSYKFIKFRWLYQELASIMQTLLNNSALRPLDFYLIRFAC